MLSPVLELKRYIANRALIARGDTTRTVVTNRQAQIVLNEESAAGRESQVLNYAKDFARINNND